MNKAGMFLVEWSGAGYLMNAIKQDKRKAVIERTEAAIRDSNVEYDAIAFMGLSGALIAPGVADRLGKPLIAVRKEKSVHSPTQVEGYASGRRYIIVDDCVASGTTVRNIFEALQKAGSFAHYEPAGIFLYNTLIANPNKKNIGPVNFVLYPSDAVLRGSPGTTMPPGWEKKAPIAIHIYG